MTLENYFALFDRAVEFLNTSPTAPWLLAAIGASLVVALEKVSR